MYNAAPTDTPSLSSDRARFDTVIAALVEAAKRDDVNTARISEQTGVPVPMVAHIRRNYQSLWMRP